MNKETMIKYIIDNIDCRIDEINNDFNYDNSYKDSELYGRFLELEKIKGMINNLIWADRMSEKGEK